MGQIILVRHGQASVLGPSYDALSPLGHTQSRLLGEHWVERGVCFDRVLIGPRQRHRETAAAVAEAFATHGLPWPSAHTMNALDEHDGLAVLKLAAGMSQPGDGLGDQTDDRDTVIRRLFADYHRIMLDWSAGQYAAEHIEPWGAFRERAATAVRQLALTPGRTAVFTSGGFIAAVTGRVLNLSHDAVIDLSSVIHNMGLTELRFQPDRIGLVSFNSIAHLRDADTITRL